MAIGPLAGTHCFPGIACAWSGNDLRSSQCKIPRYPIRFAILRAVVALCYARDLSYQHHSRTLSELDRLQPFERYYRSLSGLTAPDPGGRLAAAADFGRRGHLCLRVWHLVLPQDRTHLCGHCIAPQGTAWDTQSLWSSYRSSTALGNCTGGPRFAKRCCAG